MLATAAGCGSSVYAEKYEKRLKELRMTSDFAVLWSGPTTLEDHDLHVNVRVPLLFSTPLSLLSADPKNPGKPLSPYEVSPTFLPPFPGQKITFRAEREDPKDRNSKFPFFLYIGDGETASFKGKLPEGETFPYKEWRTAIQRALPDAKTNDWEKVEVKTPQGQTVTWKRLVAKGKQKFDFVRLWQHRGRPRRDTRRLL